MISVVGYIKFELPVGHPSGAVQEAFGLGVGGGSGAQEQNVA